jgi:hypothetical protein
MNTNTISHVGQRLLTGLTATGTNQATAYPLWPGNTQHEFTTVASGTGALLPSAIPSTISVHNAGANALLIYPPVGGTIDGGSVNAPATVAAGATSTFWVAEPLSWYTSALVGGGTGTVTSIVAGTGLSGGTITTTGTIALATIPTLDVMANTTGGTAAPAGVTLSALLDAAIGSTQGDILYRDSAAWQVLAPGTSGQILASQGAAANPHWITGTVTRQYLQVANVTATAAADTSLVSTTGAVGSMSLAAGALNTLGTTLRITAYGYASTAASSQGAIGFMVKLGSNWITTTSTFGLAANNALGAWSIDLQITTKATGATGKLDAFGHVRTTVSTGAAVPFASNAFQNAVNQVSVAPATQVTLDLTAAWVLDLIVNLSATGNAITITNLTVEILK